MRSRKWYFPPPSGVRMALPHYCQLLSKSPTRFASIPEILKLILSIQHSLITARTMPDFGMGVAPNQVAGLLNTITVRASFNFRPLANTLIVVSGLSASLTPTNPSLRCRFLLETGGTADATADWKREEGVAVARLPIDNPFYCDSDGRHCPNPRRLCICDNHRMNRHLGYLFLIM